MHVSRLAAALAIVLAANAFASGPALAQAVPEVASTDEPSSATTLDAIVVTGEKANRDLQDTTSSVAVATAQRIEQENLLSLSDLINRTPNVTPMYGHRGFTIRGIADESGAANPLATTYLDGAALPSQASDIAPTDLWDIEQVELFRGPQSTIQGQNALAGAIILHSTDPTMDWSGRARALLSDPSDIRVAFAGGGPIVTDELAFRVSAERRDFDGYIHNPTRGTGEDAAESTSGRAKLLWTPRAIDGLAARLTLSHEDRDGPYMYSYVRSDLPDYPDRRINTSDYPNTSHALSKIATLALDYAIDDRWTLSSVSAWSDIRVQRSYDGDLRAVDESYGDRDGRYRGRSQELRLRFDGDRLSGLVGAYWSRRDTEDAGSNRVNIDTPLSTISAVLQGSGFPADAADAIASLYGQALPVIPVDYLSTAPTRSENRALFADGQWRLGERWALLAGARYDRERYTFSNFSQAAFAGTLPNPAAFGTEGTPMYLAIAGINQAVLGLVAQASGGDSPPDTREFTAFLPKAGVRWSWAPDRSLALVVQRGYRSGGSSFNVARSSVYAYEPEYTWNYELALRTQWLDGRLGLNANVYYIDWKDKQVTAFFGLNSYDYHTVNAGRAHLYGFEAEGRYRVSPGFDLYGSLGYARTQYDQFETVLGASIENYAGREFVYAPRWTAAIGGNWRWENGLFANLNASFRDRVRFDVGSGGRSGRARTLVNAKAGYGNTDWSAYLFGSNLLDQDYVQYAWSDEPNAVLGAPRVVGIGFEAYW